MTDKPIAQGETICTIEKSDIEKLKSLEAESALIKKQTKELFLARYNLELRHINVWSDIRKKYLLDNGNYEVNFLTHKLIRK